MKHMLSRRNDGLRSAGHWHAVTAALVVITGAIVIALGGCARSGSTTPIGPSVVVDFSAQFAGPINDACYYFIPINTSGDFGQSGPIPVAAGPYWENGWGTGAFSHYIEYHQGQYNVYKTTVQPTLRTAGGGITDVSGVPTTTAVGTSVLTVGSLSFGAVTVAGSGMIVSATNTGFQAAGTLSLATDAAGHVVAGSASFTPGGSGGRSLTPAEQVVLTTLNAGGVPLTASSLAGLGVSLTVATAQAGTQTLTIAPTTAIVQNVFTPASASSGRGSTTTGTLQANTINNASTSPLPGASITVADLVPGGAATVALDFTATAVLLGPPFDYTLPHGSNTLHATIDLAMLGSNLSNLSVNFITTTELIFDPTITDPALHCYDGLGRLGNRYVSFRTDQFQTITNASGLFEQEMANDPTLQGRTTQDQRNSIDIVDWSITIRRLR